MHTSKSPYHEVSTEDSAAAPLLHAERCRPSETFDVEDCEDGQANQCNKHACGTHVKILLLSLIASVPLHICFAMPSTLYLFLTWSIIIGPAEVFLLTRGGRLWPWRTKKAKTTCVDAMAWRNAASVCCIAWSLVTWSTLLAAIVQGMQKPASSLASVEQRTDVPEKVFIAADLYQSAKLFPAFSTSILTLCNLLGPQNAYISIYESNSQDDTCKHLKELGNQLSAINVQFSIVCGVSDGRFDNSGGRRARVKYLAEARNKVLSPLQKAEGAAAAHSNPSKILWLNDIVFNPADIVTLLNTNGGDYDQACAIDLFALGFYDTWVARDVNARRLKPLWPYFIRSEDVAILRRKEPILVDSCWNGATAFDAAWFTLDPAARAKLGLPDATDKEDDSTFNVTLPLSFRAADSRTCAASQCLYTSFDQHVASKPFRPSIFINPKVNVSYNALTYWLYHSLSDQIPVKVWAFLWQDLVSHRLFGWLTDVGRKIAPCAEQLSDGWASSTDKLRRDAIQRQQSGG